MNNYKFKKERETELLEYFLAEYGYISSSSIQIIKASERPDFICIRENGNIVGIELCMIRRGHPNDIMFELLIEKQEHMSIDSALNMIREKAIEKEYKRLQIDWEIPEHTILLFSLTDIPLWKIKNFITIEHLPDLYDTGFSEIWLADFTSLEEFDNVELFCIKPEKLVGYYKRNIQKAYG
ncbi:MAG: hypothetical protein ABRQ35_06715 [Smithellaceae bacterium]